MDTFSVLYSEDYVLTGINLNLLDLDITIIDMFYNALHKPHVVKYNVSKIFRNEFFQFYTTYG